MKITKRHMFITFEDEEKATNYYHLRSKIKTFNNKIAKSMGASPATMNYKVRTLKFWH